MTAEPEPRSPIDRLLDLSGRTAIVNGASGGIGASIAAALAGAGAAVVVHWLVATNPPFLGRAAQGESLRTFLADNYPVSAADLAMGMAARMEQLVLPSGQRACVLPRHWLSLRGFGPLRRHLLAGARLSLLARLGSHAFAGISGEIVNVVLAIFEASRPDRDSITLAIDVSGNILADDKADALRSSSGLWLSQLDWLDFPESRITQLAQTRSALLGDVATAQAGIWQGEKLDHPERSVEELARLARSLPCSPGLREDRLTELVVNRLDPDHPIAVSQPLLVRDP